MSIKRTRMIHEWDEQREIENSKLIIEWARKNNAKVEMINTHQLRIKRRFSILDVFPGTNKFHNIVKGTTGGIWVEIPNFLDRYLLGIGIPPKVKTEPSKSKPIKYIPCDVNDIEFILRKKKKREKAPRSKWN